MLEPRQRLRFAEDISGNLQDDAPAGEARLLGQVNAAEGPLPQLLEEPEAEKLLAWLGKATDGPGHAQRRFGVGAVRVPENFGLLGLFAKARTPVVHVAVIVGRKQPKLPVSPGGALQAGVGRRIAGGDGHCLRRFDDWFRNTGIVGPVGGVQPEALGIFVRRDILPRQAAQPVFLKRDFRKRLGVLEEVRKRGHILFQTLPLPGAPGIFQIDANELAEHVAMKRMFRRG